jgi:PhnB protein
MAKSIPDGFHAVTPHLTIRECEKALPFYEKAFGAEILGKSIGPGGKIMHAAVKIGDSMIMMADEFPEMGEGPSRSPLTLGGTTVSLQIYCPDADALYERAVKAGAEPRMPPADMFWGDRYSQVRDPFGHSWAIATRKEDLTFEEQTARGQKWLADFAQQGKPS